VKEGAFGSFVLGDCAGVSESVTELHDQDESNETVALYTAAAAACSAALLGQQEKWAEAERAIALVAEADRLDCLDRPVFDTVVALVKAHAQLPDARFARATDPPVPSPCPRIRELSPDHGSRTVAHFVEFVGENLPPLTTVHAGDQVVAVPTDGRTGRVEIPPEDDPVVTAVAVWPQGWPLDGTNTAEFSFDD
jgi:hypothetical protein